MYNDQDGAFPFDDRVVEIFAPGGKVGAGLAVGDFGILTARHVVDSGLRGAIQVRIVRRSLTPLPRALAHVVADDDAWDLAVLRVDSEFQAAGSWAVPASALPAGAILGTRSQDRCEAVGFPDAAIQCAMEGVPSQYLRQTEHVQGVLLPMGDARQPVAPGRGLPREWMPLDVSTATPSGPADWAGMSGACVVLADRRLAGIVTHVDPGRPERRLLVVPLSPAIRESARLAAALRDVGAGTLVESVQPVRVLHRPPDLVPSAFYDRADVLASVTARLAPSSTRFAALIGAAGVGKTAVVAALLADLTRTVPTFPVSAFEYISAWGNRPVTAATLIEILAAAHPDAATRARLQDRVQAPDGSLWDKADDVLRDLDGRRMLLVLDNAERLLTRQGDIDDRSLREFVDYLARPADHGVQLLFVSSVRPRFRLRGFSPADSVQMPAELPRPARTEFLQRLAPGAGGDSRLARLCDLAGGRPRTLELIAVVLAESGASLAALTQAMRAGPADRLPLVLLDHIAGRLPEADAWVLRAVAVFGRPVPADAVSSMLQRDCAAALASLAGRRIVRTDHDGGYYLPPDEAEHLLAGIPVGRPADRGTQPRPLTKIALWYHAAEVLERLADMAGPVRIDDLGPRFAAIDLRAKSGDYDGALLLMNALEEDFLDQWGHNDALSGLRATVAGKLSEPLDEVDNLQRMAYAASRRERHEEALRSLAGARRANAPLRASDQAQYIFNELRLMLELAGTYLDAGHETKAAGLYADAVVASHRQRRPVDEAAARSGLALCLTEMADFDGAVRNCEGALRLLDPGTGDAEVPLLRAQLTLNLGVAQLYRSPWPDEAIATLRAARELSAGTGDQVLTARCVDALALATLAEDNGRALALARQAAAVAAETGAAELAREANATLALVHLRRSNEDELGLAAATVAAEFGRSRRGFSGLAMQGIALLRTRAPADAEGAFLRAHGRAAELRRHEGNAYQLCEYDGLALTGLAIASGSADFLTFAAASYRRARRLTLAPGAVWLCLQKLDALLAGIDEPEFDAIRAAARGSRPR